MKGNDEVRPVNCHHDPDRKAPQATLVAGSAGSVRDGLPPFLDDPGNLSRREPEVAHAVPRMAGELELHSR